MMYVQCPLVFALRFTAILAFVASVFAAKPLLLPPIWAIVFNLTATPIGYFVAYYVLGQPFTIAFFLTKRFFIDLNQVPFYLKNIATVWTRYLHAPSAIHTNEWRSALATKATLSPEPTSLFVSRCLAASLTIHYIFSSTGHAQFGCTGFTSQACKPLQFLAAVKALREFSWHKNTPSTLLPDLLSTQIGSAKGVLDNDTIGAMIQQLTYLCRHPHYNTLALGLQ